MTQSEFRLLLLRFALLPIVCLLAFAALTSLEVHHITRTRAQGARATSALLDADRLLNNLVDEETSIRGFTATGDSSFLEPYHDSASRVPGNLDELAAVVAPDALLEAEVAGIRADFDRFDLINRHI